MPRVNVYDMQGKIVEEIELDSNIFGVEVNTHCMHMAVVNNLANKRQGTHSTLVKSEVSGGGKKPYRPCKTGKHKIRAVDSRRYRIRPQAAGLQLYNSQKSKETCSEIFSYEQSKRRRYYCTRYAEF